MSFVVPSITTSTPSVGPAATATTTLGDIIEALMTEHQAELLGAEGTPS